jgi:16S rRNA (cytidine1402-2'-O)-methyltransferase
MRGNLYIVATPIGNLEDITFRALNVLKEVDIIAAEDTRQTLKLLNHYNISKHLISYHRHNEEIKSEYLIEKLLNGENIALVSDAGTPGISDPGEQVIKKAIENEIEVIPIPGACAMINALICSGIDTTEFMFLGFLPLNKKLRKEKLEEIRCATKTIILYEAPHKMKNTLKDLKNYIEGRKLVLVRELTKIHEEFIRKPIDELITEVENLKGEMILVIEGGEGKVENLNNSNDLSIEEQYKIYEAQGLTKNEIIKKIAKDRKTTKNEIYQMFIEK